MFGRAIILGLLLLAPSISSAITLGEAQAEAHAWVIARQDAIQGRVFDCIAENSRPTMCHTAWAASTTPNTVAADSALKIASLDDPGRYVTGPCTSCFTGEGTFALAGINISANAPINAKINIMNAPTGWGVQLEIEIQYEGVLYRRAYAQGQASGYAWREVE